MGNKIKIRNNGDGDENQVVGNFIQPCNIVIQDVQRDGGAEAGAEYDAAAAEPVHPLPGGDQGLPDQTCSRPYRQVDWEKGKGTEIFGRK